MYKNRDWLYNQYWNKKKSAYQIAKKCKVFPGTIYYWMKKLNISFRSRSEAIRERFSSPEMKKKLSNIHIGSKHSEKSKKKMSKSMHLAKANHCQLSQKANNFVIGHLLGDGALQSRSFYSAFFSFSFKFEEYINYIASTLKSFGIKQMGEIRNYYWGERLYDFIFRYQSCCYEELKSLHNKWYPNGKKVIPKDIELASLSCKEWYMDDGCLVNREKRNPHITLSTHAFSIFDVEWLVQQLNDLGFKVTRQKSSNIIRFSTYSTEDFLNYIGKCPVECYEYKWNYRKYKKGEINGKE